MHEIGVLALHGVVQHYDWGGHDFIPGLLGIANSDGRPFAELWMGAHPKAPATANVAGVAMPLHRLIAEAPDRILGPFGQSVPRPLVPREIISECSPSGSFPDPSIRIRPIR